MMTLHMMMMIRNNTVQRMQEKMAQLKKNGNAQIAERIINPIQRFTLIIS